MVKMINAYVWRFLSTTIATFLLFGCGAEPSFVPPTSQLPTASPPYLHYILSQGAGIHIEFDYPSSWVFKDRTPEYGMTMIFLEDPRVLSLPTQSAIDHDSPNDLGGILIWVDPLKPGQSPAARIEEFKQGSRSVSWTTLINEYKIVIDGYEASVFEYQHDPSEIFSSVMFEKRIFINIQDQMIHINFTVAEEDRGGEFEKGYEYFLDSIQIIGK